MVDCPICGKQVKEAVINAHIDSGCTKHIDHASPATSQQTENDANSKQKVASIFSRPALPKTPSSLRLDEGKINGNGNSVSADGENGIETSTGSGNGNGEHTPKVSKNTPQPAESKTVEEPITPVTQPTPLKRSFDNTNGHVDAGYNPPPSKKPKTSALESVAPLAERMRPKTLDEVYGQEDLLGPDGVLRTLIETNRVPSMILWGAPGTGKTSIARLIANTAGTRFVEINSTTTGVGEVKKLFDTARAELGLTGRKTIIFCDEIHRFSKSQQDVFLGPVEAGAVTLVGATTENPSFKVISALLSRCRVFTLAKLTSNDITAILSNALTAVHPDPTSRPALLSQALLAYLSTFADGDARTALNLFALAIDLAPRANQTLESLKSALTKTLVYDRAGDQHFDTISAFHKSIRGGSADAALYYLARMLASGEDALYIARRMVVIASEDVGLADNTLLSLATATYTAAEKIGLPEARINLAHCAVALAQAPKSTRAYRGLGAAMAALKEPGIAALPVPLHLRNAPTRLMKEMGYGAQYKYNPDYVDGRVRQEYLPEGIRARLFLEERDLGDKVDEELDEGTDAEGEVELEAGGE